MIKKNISVVVPRTDKYKIIIEEGALNKLGYYLQNQFNAQSAVVVSDKNVSGIYNENMKLSLEEANVEMKIITLPVGEKTKSLHTSQRLYKQMLELGVCRRTIIVAFGGGMISDTMGFVSSTYMRGIPYINVPTSLLAQVDSSIGGKVAVNHPKGKNLIGSFYHPSGVYIDPNLLKTLPLCQIRNGLAEVIKTAIISDSALFEFIEKNVEKILSKDIRILTQIVSRTAELKVNLLKPDPYEVDLRRPLNFGHTVGHAVEKVEAYNGIRHGEAVAVGMAVATNIAMQRGLCSESEGQRIINLLNIVGLPTYSIAQVDEIWEAMSIIRMIRDGSLNFVMPNKKIGETIIINDLEKREIINALTELRDNNGRKNKTLVN